MYVNKHEKLHSFNLYLTIWPDFQRKKDSPGFVHGIQKTIAEMVACARILGTSSTCIFETATGVELFSPVNLSSHNQPHLH